jgi:hypothetical protein
MISPHLHLAPAWWYVYAALVMRWGERQVGGVINYPGYIYRQLMTRSQMEGWLEGGHHSGIANLIPDQCLRGNETGPPTKKLSP